MKKSWILFSVLSIILVSNLVSAVVELPAMTTTDVLQPLTNLVTGFIKMFADILDFAVGGAGLGTLAFTKLMFFILLVAVLYYPSKVIARQNRAVALLISAIVSILGARFIDDKILMAVLLPYGALAVAVSALIPFIIFGIFIESQDFPRWVRKVGWIGMLAVFIGLYLFRSSELGDGVIIYGIFGIACLIGFGMDSYFQKLKLYGQTGKEANRALQNEVNNLKGEYEGKLAEYRRTPLDQRRPGMILELNELRRRILEIEKLQAKFK